MIFKDSRYTKVPVVFGEGISTFSRRKTPSFNLTDCIIHTVVVNDTLDQLAYQYYGNATLWWAILDANIGVVTEYFNIEPGTRLKIPNYEEVMEVVKSE